ncbi:MAG: DsbA family protein, partial [Bdellovibrionales bacterium]|nr:DsbA family protein [Bdellovibrionales bacterium]
MDYKKKDASILAQAYDLELNPHDFHHGEPKGNKLLHKLGHYQGGMFYYRGQWFMGLDRVNLLLEQLSLAPLEPNWAKIPKISGTLLQFYFSFRSPYSFLAIYEVEKLIKDLNIQIEYKPLLPMAMRGFKIPKSKKMYIFKDAARLAHKRGISFGKVYDPLGEGVLNVLKLFCLAQEKKQELLFCKLIFEAIWSKGQNLTRESNLIKVLSPLGWQKDEIIKALHNEGPKDLIKNKEELKGHGL